MKEGGADGSGPQSSLRGEGVVASGGEFFLSPEHDRGTTRNDGRGPLAESCDRTGQGRNYEREQTRVEQRIAALAFLAKIALLLAGGGIYGLKDGERPQLAATTATRHNSPQLPLPGTPELE